MKLSVLLAAAALLGPAPLFAQQSPGLIGHWDGALEGLPAGENPARVLRVHSVGADGKAIVVWATPGAAAAQIEGATDGSTLKIAFTTVKATVELARQGDDALAGKFTSPNGNVYPIKFKKATLSTEFDGEWQGPAENNPKNTRECTDGNYFVTVKESLVTGTFRVLSRVGSGALEASVTGEIQPDKTAALELRPLSPLMASARFTGAFSGSEFHGKDPAVGSRRCGYDVNLKKR